MVIEVLNRQRLVRIDNPGIARLIEATLAAVGREGANLTAVFVRDRAMRDLNYRFRDQHRATDVLSFPAQEENAGEGFSVTDEPEFLGDIVVSVDRAHVQAQDAGHSLERELKELVMHGTLHLCGYDHETDRGEMNRLELRLRKKLLTEE